MSKTNEYHVYILQNTANNKLYIGYTGNLKQRVRQHRAGKSQYTRKQPGHWQLLYYKTMPSKSEAISLERKLKRWKNKKRVLAWVQRQKRISQ